MSVVDEEEEDGRVVFGALCSGRAAAGNNFEMVAFPVVAACFFDGGTNAGALKRGRFNVNFDGSVCCLSVFSFGSSIVDQGGCESLCSFAAVSAHREMKHRYSLIFSSKIR